MSDVVNDYHLNPQGHEEGPIPDGRWNYFGVDVEELDRARALTPVKDEQAGVKFDGDKPRMDLIAPSILTALSEILTFGAKKYAARNWEKGMSYGRAFGALMRHLWAWWGGEKTDPETGKSHLWHAACCIMFLIEWERRVAEGTLPDSLDDRPVPYRA